MDLYYFFHQMSDPIKAAGAWPFLPAALWLIVMLSYALPRFADTVLAACRDSDRRTALFALLAVCASLYAFPSKASKGGGGTNEPAIPPAVPPAGVINLYHEVNGRLVPIGVPIGLPTPIQEMP